MVMVAVPVFLIKSVALVLELKEEFSRLSASLPVDTMLEFVTMTWMLVEWIRAPVAPVIVTE